MFQLRCFPEGSEKSQEGEMDSGTAPGIMARIGGETLASLGFLLGKGGGAGARGSTGCVLR